MKIRTVSRGKLDLCSYMLIAVTRTELPVILKRGENSFREIKEECKFDLYFEKIMQCMEKGGNR